VTDISFNLTIYLKSTGEIKYGTYHACEAIHKDVIIANTLASFGSDYGVLDVASDPQIHYVSIQDGIPQIQERPPVPYKIDRSTVAANGVDFVTISGLHDPCTIVIDDPDPLVETVTETVTGGGFEFSADTIGVYTIQISKFPFLPLTFQITAISPVGAANSDFSTDFSYEFGH